MTAPTDPGTNGGDGAAEPLTGRAVSLKLTLTARQLHRRFDQSVAAKGITRSQWTLVAVVSRRPGVTQREAAALLDMSEAAVGRLIDRLCTEGLLVRRPKDDDRRAYQVHLTEATDAMLERISTIATAHEATMFAGFSSADVAQLNDYLDRIAANIASDT